ncbi:matrilysin isoform X2 [Nematostella vectensis]|uniref:matrilysin isoform X2 n=1 Tax=Nematostella vectensis TaxID=45351 RepID=UPI002076FBED|nr:matrilysin isoform X2 [Nematostella vectensis]
MKMLVFAGLLSLIASAVSEDDDQTMALKYLNQFHYISPSRSGNHDVKTALEKFQSFAGLPVTGEIDAATIAQMKMPRCGMPDVDDDGLRIRRYNLHRKWNMKHLTYHISYGQDLSRSVQDRVFAKALDYWAQVSGLSFSRTFYGQKADLKISFGPKSHGGPHDPMCTCVHPFDGPGNTLAHAFYPSDGVVHFDEDEDFTDGTSEGMNLLWVATHEFGHSLGLRHTDVQDAVMFPYYTGYEPGFDLKADDIAGIRALYGDENSGGSQPCVDNYKSCPGWTAYCNNDDYVIANCRKSCGSC